MKRTSRQDGKILKVGSCCVKHVLSHNYLMMT